MKREEEYEIEEIESELEDDYSDEDLYKIKSWGLDVTFRELITMYDEDELVKPEMQRNYVWSRAEASRFIDSLLLGLPVPSIFLANTKDHKKIIVDGYQRIMTVYDFVTGRWSDDKKVSRLSRSDKVNDKWQGRAFVELSSTEQRKIKTSMIHAIIFEQSHPRDGDTSLFQVFERINTSGKPLTPQEIRNCVYQGPFNKFLLELNKEDGDWRNLYGLEGPDNRMRDVEFLLRFFALQDEAIREAETGRISLKKHLNLYMEKMNLVNEDEYGDMEIVFGEVTEYLNEKIGDTAFVKVLTYQIDDGVTRHFHPTIFDSIAIATAKAFEEKKLIDDPDELMERKDSLLNDEEYENYISTATTRVDHIKGRIRIAYRYLYEV